MKSEGKKNVVGGFSPNKHSHITSSIKMTHRKKTRLNPKFVKLGTKIPNFKIG